jgi:cyclophilin family peptidyl-prolyl cis-trans isomerase
VNSGLFKSGSAALWCGLMLLILMAGCGGKTTSNSNNSGSSPTANIKRGIKPEPDAEVAVIEMENPTYGKIVIELYPNIAPKMVERFKQLIKEGFYNGTAFHRISPRLGIIQGGDPLSKDDDPNNDGGGDSPYPDLPGEFSDLPYERGTVGAARQGKNPDFGVTDEQARNTGNCQFYITLKRVPDFDENYTVFGRVIEGISNADVIAGAPVEPPRPGRPEASQPSEKIVVKSITLQPHK